MKIRKATLKDAGKVAKIEYDSGYRWRDNNENKEAKRILNSKWSETYILEEKKREVAYFTIAFKKKGCYVNFFSVTKSRQRKGVASRLMGKIISMARKNKCKKIGLTVWAKNFPAIGLYNKFEFYITDIKRRYYPNKDDKLRMEKIL